MHRPEIYKPKDADLKGKARLIVAKNRNGRIGTVDLTWIPEITEFRDLATRYGEEMF